MFKLAKLNPSKKNFKSIAMSSLMAFSLAACAQTSHSGFVPGAQGQEVSGMRSSLVSTSASTCTPVMVAYPSWKHTEMPASDIPWHKFTHLALSFAIPKENGELDTSHLDSFIEETVVEGHKNNTKVALSVGGATGSKAFLAITSDPERQTYFINNLLAYVNKHDIDGIDIDWEYWTFQNEQGKGGNDPKESKQLLSLVAELNKKRPDGLTLTVDIFAGPWIGPQYLPELQKHVDHVNLMAYDFSGAWSQSPIKHHSDWDTYLLAVEYALHSGFSKEKLSIGLPTYGIEFIDGKNNKVKHYTYPDIIEKLNATNTDINKGRIGNIYYETPELTTKKSHFIKNNNFGGVFFFELTGDHQNDEYSLITASNKVIDPALCQ